MDPNNPQGQSTNPPGQLIPPTSPPAAPNVVQTTSHTPEIKVKKKSKLPLILGVVLVLLLLTLAGFYFWNY